MNVIRPQKLTPGATIAIISPCNGMKAESVAPAAERIRSLGYNVVFGKHAFSFTDGYAASAEERAADFNDAIADKTVDMILFPGGEIANEILPLIDFDAVKRNPKIICSYSDGTTILNAVHSKTGLITFYSGSTRLFDPMTDYNFRSFSKRLTSSDNSYDKADEWKVICPGRAEGVLCGGYIVNFDLLIGSEYFDLPNEDYILIIEDHEKFNSPKVVSKWLSDMVQKGAFKRATGMIFGHYTTDPAKLEKLFAVIKRVIGPLGIPVVYTDDFGHGVNMSILPLGVHAKLDTEAATFELAENGTRVASIESETFPAVCAHRGYSLKYPENSLEAFEQAIRCGADEIELDVRLTADGKMVISHDNKLERISDGREGEKVSTSTLDYLKTLNIGIKHGTVARFCTPDEVFSAIGGRIILNIHLKESGEDGYIIRSLAALARSYGIENSVYFAGSPRELEAMQKYAPEIPRTAIQLPKDTIGICDMAKTYDCARVQLWSGLYDSETIKELKSLGVKINLYHAETPDEITAALSDGIDVILANDSATAVGVIKQ